MNNEDILDKIFHMMVNHFEKTYMQKSVIYIIGPDDMDWDEIRDLVYECGAEELATKCTINQLHECLCDAFNYVDDMYKISYQRSLDCAANDEIEVMYG